MEPVRKLLYIAGWGRSGSTIIGNVLNEVPGFWHGGEIYASWRKGMVENQPCGCGLPFSECRVWGEVTKLAFGDSVSEVGDEVGTALWSPGPMNRHLLWLLVGDRLVPPVPPAALEQTSLLYETLSEKTGARVIVDGSKFPFYAYLLSCIPTIDLYLLHVVRDPRASAYSWQKSFVRQDAKGSEKMTQFSPTQSTLKWVGHNVATELLRNRVSGYVRMRYEDVMASPRDAVRAVGSLLSEEVGALDFIEGHTVHLGTNHTVWGNPLRQRGGAVSLRADDAWKEGLSIGVQRKVEAVSWPLAVRYGYRL